MSEYQFLAFRAVDRPLTARELAYAHKQSSRAEITRWYFENEYHFGDFGGDADGLARLRGRGKRSTGPIRLASVRPL